MDSWTVTRVGWESVKFKSMRLEYLFEFLPNSLDSNGRSRPRLNSSQTDPSPLHCPAEVSARNDSLDIPPARFIGTCGSNGRAGTRGSRCIG